jgi:DNA-binding SARP family transcriptional activator
MTTTPAAPLTTIRLLGGFAVRCGPHDVPMPPAAQHVVARVALARRLSRTVLAASLWPEMSESRAHGNLRNCLWHIRRLCGGLVVQDGDCLVIAPLAQVDVHRTHAVALQVLRNACGVPTETLLESVDTSELLAGWYDDWVLVERERDRELRLHALEVSSRELLQRGLPGAAMLAALAAVQLEPLRESAQRAVIEVHLSEGNVAAALASYRSYRALLGAEVGLEPTPALRQLLTTATADLVPPAPRERTVVRMNGQGGTR